MKAVQGKKQFEGLYSKAKTIKNISHQHVEPGLEVKKSGFHFASVSLLLCVLGRVIPLWVSVFPSAK